MQIKTCKMASFIYVALSSNEYKLIWNDCLDFIKLNVNFERSE